MKRFKFLLILIISLIIFTGFSPVDILLQKETYKEHQLSNSLNSYQQKDFNKTLQLFENHQLIDSFIYTTKKECISDTLSKYKDILITQTNNYIKSNDYISAINLLNSKSKYYKNDETLSAFNTLKLNKIHKQNEQEYIGAIEHLTFNTLMAFPEKALNKDNNFSAHYDETKITKNEFYNILCELYKNNYILISIKDIIDIKSNKKNSLFLPLNKKPIILSFNNVTYKSNYQNLGEIDKIIIDRNNNIASYTTKQSIQDRVQYNNEFILILENFIKEHPDFSHNNAKGLIFVSGENGILGYNTNHNNASSKYEAKRVSEVIHKLKNLGWEFGCNNYTYSNENLKSEIEFAKDISLWNREIRPIIGESNLYASPLGIEIDSNTKKELLIANGYNIFFIDNISKTYLNNYGNLFYMSRTPINGKTLRENSTQLTHLFSAENVYDHSNRTIPFYLNN